MAMSSAVVAVGTTAVALNATDTTNRAGMVGQSILVRNTHSSKATVYLGGPDVTSSNGVPLLVDETLPIQIGPSEIVYARTASGTVSLYCLYQGV